MSLQRELKKKRPFKSAAQEAVLNVLRTGALVADPRQRTTAQGKTRKDTREAQDLNAE